MMARCASLRFARVDPEAVRLVVGAVGKLLWREREEVGDRVAGHLDADAVEDDDAGDALAAEEGDLGSDPAAQRVAGHGDVAEVELLQQGDGEAGQAAGVAQVLGPRRAVEAGEGGDDDARRPPRRQVGREWQDRGGAGPAVQQEERTAGADLLDSELDRRGGAGARDGDRGGPLGSHINKLIQVS
jgi:hypothetical protein